MTRIKEEPLQKYELDRQANLDIDCVESSFYEGVTLSKLDPQEFADFWVSLAEKNRRHFTFPDETEAETADQNTPLLAIGGFDASSLLPGFGLLSLNISVEEAIPKLDKLFSGRLNHSEIFQRTLEFCIEPQDFNEVEMAIQEFPEFPLASQSPFRFIKMLVDAGGLDRISLDVDGNEVTVEMIEGLSEDEVDDLVARFVLKTTEAGKEIAEVNSPKRRLRDLINNFSDRSTVFRDLLSYVKSTPCKYEDIEKLFAGRDFSGLRTIGMEKHVALKPSVFVNNMEKAGGMVWKDGHWTITKEGEALLEELIQRGTIS